MTQLLMRFWCRVVGHEWTLSEVACRVLSLIFLGMFQIPEQVCRRCGARYKDQIDGKH